MWSVVSAVVAGVAVKLLRISGIEVLIRAGALRTTQSTLRSNVY